MTKYIFDVDGVLCDTGQHIDPEFAEYFESWTKDNVEINVLDANGTNITEKNIVEKIGIILSDDLPFIILIACNL